MHHLLHQSSTFRRRAGSLTIAIAALFCGSVWADEYSEVLSLMRAGKYTESLAKADATLASKPKDAQMLFVKGSVLQASGQQDAALALFTQLTQDYPELPEPYNNMAVILAAQNQFEKARIALEMAIRNKPDYAIAHENLGDVYAKLAVQSYAKALQFNPVAGGVKSKQSMINDVFKTPEKPQKQAGKSQ